MMRRIAVLSREIDMRALTLFAASLALIATSAAPAYAAGKQCRDAKGKFIKCADKAAPAKRCKDSKGKFAKCGTPGAKPA